MMFPKTTIAPSGGAGRPGWLLPLLLAGAVHVGLSAVAYAGGAGEGFVIRSGESELRSAAPREAGKVPVVFIHGMLGSPANWSVMIDRLSADPLVVARFQLLTFGYDSLQPIPDSGRELLETLAEARRRFDPEGRDDSFDRVVLVGFSLGGLVAKAVAVRADGPPGPRVGRVIFVATPHRGTPVDRGVTRSLGTWIARAVNRSIVVPQAEGDPDALRSPTSVDQLTWDNPLLRDLERARADTGVLSHSIIAALRDPTAEGATDGLVPVASARIGDARSEVVVMTSHLCFEHPEVIWEIHRILDEHAESALPARPRLVGSPRVGSRGTRSIPPVPPEASLVTLRRPADMLSREPTAAASRPIRPGLAPEHRTP